MQFFRSIYYRLVKSRGAKIAAGVLLVLLLGGVYFALGPGKLNSPAGRAKFLRAHPAVFRLLPVYWKFRKISDITYLPYFFRKDNVPTYELTIEPSELEKINQSLPASYMDTTYTKKVFATARFEADGKIYDVKLRYRGDNAQHWNAPKKSYLIRFENELFHGMRAISLFIPNDRYFALEHTNNYRAEKLGLKIPQSGYANLKINGKNHGLYFQIESWEPEMLINWGLPADTPLYGEVDLEQTGGDIWTDITLWQDTAHDDPYPFKHDSKLPELLRLLNESSDSEFYARIFDLVDRDNFYAWQIHQELVNSNHQQIGNVRMYFDRARGKFFFVPWDVEYDILSRDWFDSYGPLQQRIFANPEFLAEKNRRLLAYVEDGQNIERDLKFYDETYEGIRVSLYRDRLKIYSNRFADSVYRDVRAVIAGQFKRLAEKL